MLRQEPEESLVKIAVPCGNYLHFLYDEEGPAFTRFPKDKLVRHSKTARLALKGTRKDLFVIPVNTAQLGGILCGFFHVLDFINTHGKSSEPGLTLPYRNTVRKEMTLEGFPFFHQILQIYYATVVLGLDGGLEQPKLHMELMHMARQKLYISVADVKFLWTHFRQVDNALVTASLHALVEHVERKTLEDQEVDDLKKFLAEDAEFQYLFEDICAKKDRVHGLTARTTAVEKRLRHYKQVLPATEEA